ncbi:hypothetical protein BUALT_Bualt18G0025000 [Buddleja alternifolia]|uniref:Myb/SANT-like domain-containing protein n=1 Tax=Buddleja alternifolia TaxID=168488 RepID=A0AAV6W2Y0_9LAMI|nr:hypothetical protein BUALT_Bualt18G0025000 [Buddleja alternifolia]
MGGVLPFNRANGRAQMLVTVPTVLLPFFLAIAGFCEVKGGLTHTKHVKITEQVAMFLLVLSHHTKNRIVKQHFVRSRYTVSVIFHQVLNALLRIHTCFLSTPKPIEENCSSDRWKWFKGCLGALDGSAADSRVLKDVVARPNGLKIPNGNYYLCDCGYTNGEGSWHHAEELDTICKNGMHVGSQTESLWRAVHAVDPIEAEVPETHEPNDDPEPEYIDQVEPSKEWSNWRDTLAHLVVRGYKCDNGFRTGYQGLLEQAMIAAFSSTDLRAEPHINSRIHVWRKNYSSISSMLKRSSFGWNSTSKTITVSSDDVWDNYVKTNVNARTMRHKSWPLFDDWKKKTTLNEATGDHTPPFKNRDWDEAQSMFVSCGVASASTKYNSSKGKRKLVDDGDAEYMSMMGVFCENKDKQLGDIAMRIGFEQDASRSRKAVFEALAEIGDLDIEQRILILKFLVNNTKDFDLFFSLPTIGKSTMVKMMLAGTY